MAAPRSNDLGSPLDRPLARLGALGVFFAVAALLGYVHRGQRVPPVVHMRGWRCHFALT
jgi:hypothetical protein